MVYVAITTIVLFVFGFDFAFRFALVFASMSVYALAIFNSIFIIPTTFHSSPYLILLGLEHDREGDGGVLELL